MSNTSCSSEVKTVKPVLKQEVVHMATTKVAIVTGASRGLGEALARALAERNWALVLDGRGAATLKAAVDRLRQTTDAQVVTVAGDVSDPAHRRALVDA